MSLLREFKIGDVVQIGSNVEKGKIIDIYKPLGTFSMYKVHTYCTGEIKSAARHELVKGLPDQDFQDLFDCFSHNDIDQAMQTIANHELDLDNNNEVCVQSIPSTQLNLHTVPPADHTVHALLVHESIQPIAMNHSAQKRKAVHFEPQYNSTDLNSKRLLRSSILLLNTVNSKKNKNTDSKTKSNMKLIHQFLNSRNELREVCMIPSEELNILVQEFILCVRQKDGTEYEPSTLRGMISSLDSGARQRVSPDNGNTSEQRERSEKKGKGNRDKAANEVTDIEIDLLYKAGELGNHCPSSLLNTLWYNNTTHFGIRGGAMEHRIQGSTPLGVTDAQWKPTRLMLTTAQLAGDHPFYLSTITHQKFPEEEEQWFLRAPVGINKLKDLMKVMARNANLPALSSGERMTNTSVRKRLCQKLLQNNVPDTQAVLITGHKNANSSNYRVLSNLQQKNPSNLLSSRLVNEGLKKLNLLARSVYY
ncbi:hypothetical protein MAR_020695 [Mya arenaria]|uniref:DUF3504 domain-containing protein n=1 Tax=Mya arenaria TaxID=6604 RepID=A0ABY7E9P1_MYAAR|nr:hypothetical protein MAR_020695 [Mya arenaria]